MTSISIQEENARLQFMKSQITPEKWNIVAHVHANMWTNGNVWIKIWQLLFMWPLVRTKPSYFFLFKRCALMSQAFPSLRKPMACPTLWANKRVTPKFWCEMWRSLRGRMLGCVDACVGRGSSKASEQVRVNATKVDQWNRTLRTNQEVKVIQQRFILL